MRISDWSSDVCSSDLRTVGVIVFEERNQCGSDRHDLARRNVHVLDLVAGCHREFVLETNRHEVRLECALGAQLRVRLRDHVARSEEHTSELQSLMRISYAVFCWKKKKTHKEYQT